MQIATFGRSQGNPTATIPYKTSNFSREEKECMELTVNNWLHQWTTYFGFHGEHDDWRIQTIRLYLRSKALTWWRDMTDKPTTWANFCVEFKKDFAKMDPLKAYAKLQSLSMRTLSFNKYTTTFKEALTFCEVVATHAMHMYLLGLHEDYFWALIKDKAPIDTNDVVTKARTFHLINGANYEKKKNIDHQSGECTSRNLDSSRSPTTDTLSRGVQEKKKARNAVIADAVKKGACLAVARQATKSKFAPRRSPRSRMDDLWFRFTNFRVTLILLKLKSIT
ncbi:hypothetical protein L7F22_001488 [Adiantum nelumboides]|nr:hypothetical protein [Adiantum nelumboides]